MEKGKSLQVSVSESQVHEAFPEIGSFRYACQLIGENKLHSETLDGLERAKEVIEQEISARTKYGKTPYCTQRSLALSADYQIAHATYKELKEKIPQQPDLIKEAEHKANAYWFATKPETALIFVVEAIALKKGRDFNDNLGGINFLDQLL